jgi:hypothetical protein
VLCLQLGRRAGAGACWAGRARAVVFDCSLRGQRPTRAREQ